MINIIRTLIIISFIPFFSACKETARGEKIGEIIELTEMGIFVKTWECKVIRGGIQDGSGSFGKAVQLTIENKNLLEKAKKCMLEKKIVSIKYHGELATFLRSDSGSYSTFVDDIEIIK